jgi:vitamin B12 transporter
MTTAIDKSDRKGLSALLLTALFGLILLLAAHSAIAQEPVAETETEAAPADSPNAELLLFWEEKELYVETATRISKPLAQTAENMTVITAREIEDMNAHTLAEVLARVPGLFVAFQGQDFSSPSLLQIQGSADRHVTVLLDGVVWNFLTSGNAETSSIPLRIIERIEIIKGPASSAWGSALGGVVNIITKSTGDSTIPKGVLSASYGEANSQDYSAELSGKLGGLDYFLHGGRQDSYGLRNDRDYSRDSFYVKLTAAPSRDLDLHFSIGFSNPNQNTGVLRSPGIDLSGKAKLDTLFATGALAYRISSELSLQGSVNFFRQRLDQPNIFLPANELFKETIYDEQTVGGNLKLVYTAGRHSAVLGLDASHGALEQTSNAGPLLQGLGAPASSRVSPSIDRWALFANDTLDFGKLAITPGIRLDRNNISGFFASPSIGATYELAERSVVRASVARGFTSPPLGFTSGGGIFFVPNPSLKAEYGWSYQLGLESGLTGYLNLKATLFRHDTANAIGDPEPIPDNLNFSTVNNQGDVTRQGYELELETVPFHNLSLRAGHAYARISADSQPKGQDNYSYLVGIRYDDRRSLMAQLTGSYIWWDLPAIQNASYDNFVWDLNLNKKIHTTNKTTLDAFLTIHNLFSGANYVNGTFPNSLRWVEGGLRFRF